MWQRVCKVVRTRRFIVMAALGTCAVVLLLLVVSLIFSVPTRDESTGTSVRLPEDGNISPQFSYNGNCTDVIIVLIAFVTHTAAL